MREKLGPITILVTSEGIESIDAVADITPEKWDRLLAVNLTGTFTCMQLAVPDMTAERLHGEALHRVPLAGTTRSTTYEVTTFAMHELVEPLSSQVWP